MHVDLTRVPVVFGRPQAGPEVLTVPALRRERDRLVEAVMDMSARGGGVLVYAFLEEEARSALMTLQLALPTLRQHASRQTAPRSQRPRRVGREAAVQVFADPVELFMEPPVIEEETRILIVHHAPRHPLLQEWLEEIPKGVVVVATGLVEEWQRARWQELFGALTTRWYRIQPDVPPGRWSAAVGPLRQRFAQDHEASQVLQWLAFFDALGVPCPLTLLGALTHVDNERFERFAWDHADVVEMFRRRHQDEWYLATVGEALSRLVLSDLWSDRQSIEERLGQVLQSAARDVLAANQAVRYAVVRSLLGAVRRGYRDVVIRICEHRHKNVMDLANHASPREVHFWAHLLQETYRFRSACELLEHCHDHANSESRPYLAHASAVAYRRWAEATDVPTSRQQHAGQALQWLAELPSQGRSGDFIEHERALATFLSHPSSALDILRQRAQGGNNVYLWISYANMLLRSVAVTPDLVEGALRWAEKVLGRSPDPGDGRRLYIEHLRGRLALTKIHFLGTQDEGLLTTTEAFQRAEDHFTKVIAVDPYNLPTLTELARLAWWRGHRGKALHWLRRALWVDPANLMALMSLGKVHEDAREWEEAEECYRQVARFHPLNLRARTSLAALAVRRGLWDQAEALLREARRVEVEQGGRRPVESMEASENTYILAIAAEFHRLRQNNHQADICLQRAMGIARAHSDMVDPAIWVELGRLQNEPTHFTTAEHIATGRRDYYDYVVTRNARAKWLLERGELSAATGLAEATYRFDPDNVHTLRLLAKLYRESREETGELERRVRELEGVLVE